MGPFLAVLGRGRHSRGSADPVGSTWCEYRAKRRHGDPFRTIFHVFGARIGVPSPARTPLGRPMGLPEPKTLIFLRFFRGWSQKPCFSLGFSRVRPNMGSNLDLPEPKWRGCLERNWGSGILLRIQPIHRIHRIHRKWCQELQFRPPLTTHRSLRMT